MSLSTYSSVFILAVLMISKDLSREIFKINTLTAIKSTLEHGCKHILRLIGLCGDQTLDFLHLACSSFVCNDHTFLKVKVKTSSMRFNYWDDFRLILQIFPFLAACK